MKITYIEEPSRSAVASFDGRSASVVAAASARFDTMIHVRGWLRDECPPTGFVFCSSSVSPETLLEEVPLESRNDLARRLVPIGIGSKRRDALAMLAKNQIPAAMDGLMVAELQTAARPTILGRSGLVEAIGASVWPPQSSDYCVIASDAHRDSLHLLADYLRALQDHG